MSSMKRRYAIASSLLRSGLGPEDRFEILAAFVRGAWNRVRGGRACLHVRRPVVIRQAGIEFAVPPHDNSFVSARPGLDQGAVVNEIVRRMRASSGAYVGVGENLGFVCMPIARAFPDRRVIAIEPMPWLADALRRTARRNKLSNVTVVECAISESPSVALEVPTIGGVHFTTLSSLVGAHRGEFQRVEKRRVRVQGRKLDEVLDHVGLAPSEVCCVKVDVEGAEPEVIGSAVPLLEAGIPLLFEAWSPDRLHAVERVLVSYPYGPPRALDQTNFVAEREAA